MMEKKPINRFNMFRINDDVKINRVGKAVTIRTQDNSFVQSETAEANLLYEILKALNKK